MGQEARNVTLVGLPPLRNMSQETRFFPTNSANFCPQLEVNIQLQAILQE